MKNLDEKVNIGAFCDVKKLYLGWEGLHAYIYVSNNRNISSNIIIILSDDDMIHTYVNMYIAFVTPVRDVKEREQV